MLLQAVCNGIEDISVMPAAPPPPLVVLTMNMRTCVSNKTNGNEIIMISCLVHNEFYVDRAAPKPPFNQHFCGKVLYDFCLYVDRFILEVSYFVYC